MPNMARPRAKIRQLAVDECRVGQDPEGWSDDTFDRGTGTWSRPGGDDTQQYQGPVLLQIGSGGQVGRHESGSSGPEAIGPARALIPIDEDDLPPTEPSTWVEGGLTLEMLTGVNDPTLVGRRFKVIGLGGGTYAAAIVLVLTEIRPDPVEDPGT